MRAKVIFLIMLMFSAIAVAVPVKMVMPFERTLDNGNEVFLGTIGPGQTMEIRIEPMVTAGGIYGNGGQYDIAEAADLPAGWSSTPSALYGKPLQVKITADKDAPEGEYKSTINVVDEKNGEQLGNVTFFAKINVTWDVLGMDVTPPQATTGPEQPTEFMITITNKGSASDTYTVSATGVKRWEFVKSIYVPARSSRTIFYEITGYEEETYTPTIGVVSVSSQNIHAEKNVSITVRSDLLGDFKATNHGVLLFPVFEAPIYALAGIIAAVLGSIGF